MLFSGLDGETGRDTRGERPKTQTAEGRPIPRRPASGVNVGRKLAEQNAKLTFEVTSSCLVMENGVVAMTGTSEELSHNSRVRQIYLGL